MSDKEDKEDILRAMGWYNAGGLWFHLELELGMEFEEACKEAGI